jgi:hypothetical protein
MWLVKFHPTFYIILFNEKNAPLGAYAMCVVHCPWKEKCFTFFIWEITSLIFAQIWNNFLNVFNNLVWWTMWLKNCVKELLKLGVESYKLLWNKIMPVIQWNNLGAFHWSYLYFNIRMTLNGVTSRNNDNMGFFIVVCNTTFYAHCDGLLICKTWHSCWLAPLQMLDF